MGKFIVIILLLTINGLGIYAQQGHDNKDYGLYSTFGGIARSPNILGDDRINSSYDAETMGGFGGNVGLIYYSEWNLNVSFNTNFRYDFIHFSDGLVENYEFISDHSLMVTRYFGKSRRLQRYLGVGYSILNFNKKYWWVPEQYPEFSYYHTLDFSTLDLIGGLQLNNWGLESRVMVNTHPDKYPFSLQSKRAIFLMIRAYYQLPIYTWSKQ